MDFDRDRQGQIILDYGCGPGNDLYRFLVINNAKKVIGIDISQKALLFAKLRLALHHIEPNRVELLIKPDTVNTIPFLDNDFDHINCAGVLQHTSNPETILREFYRVVKPKTTSNIMVYNYNSIWVHLNIPFVCQIIKGKYADMDAQTAFSKDTDGKNCPISRCYKPEEFIALCANAGFQTEFVGGYLSMYELENYQKYKRVSLKDPRLGAEHKVFLRSLKHDKKGYPLYDGKYAGASGVYKLYKN